jgi:hypothetical protein
VTQKPSAWSKSNRGVSARSSRDLEALEAETGESRVSESQRQKILAKKAAQYAQLQCVLHSYYPLYSPSEQSTERERRRV